MEKLFQKTLKMILFSAVVLNSKTIAWIMRGESKNVRGSGQVVPYSHKAAKCFKLQHLNAHFLVSNASYSTKGKRRLEISFACVKYINGRIDVIDASISLLLGLHDLKSSVYRWPF